MGEGLKSQCTCGYEGEGSPMHSQTFDVECIRLTEVSP